MIKLNFLSALIFIVCIFLCQIDADAKMREKDYVNMYCTGKKEYMLPDKTRVDCLTEEYAVEFDFAKKWAESIGQCLYYSKMTGKKPAAAIIITKPSDMKYIKRIQTADENIHIFIIPACKKHCPAKLYDKFGVRKFSIL